MKACRCYLILAAFLLVAGTKCQCQGTLFSDTVFSGISNIVRYSDGEGAFINVSKDPTLGFHFSWTDLSTIKNVYFPMDFTVCDLEILGDTAFFCGEDHSGMSGFLGWFSVHDLFWGSGSVHVDNSLSALDLASLLDIEIYRETSGTKVHVAGYGKHPIPNESRYLALEAAGFPQTGMQYRVAELSVGDRYDAVESMAVTDMHVVYMESLHNTKCPIHPGAGYVLEVFPKYDLFSPSTFPYFVVQAVGSHYESLLGCSYVLTDHDEPMLNSHARMVHIGADKVAICSYRAGLSYVPSGFQPWPDCDACDIQEWQTDRYLVHRTYDIGPVQAGNPIQMLTATQSLVSDQVDAIDDFVYDRDNQHYIVLHRLVHTPGMMESAVTTLDFSLGVPSYMVSDYQTVMNTYSDWIPESLCLYGEGGYLVSGWRTVGQNHLFWKTNVLSQDGNCDHRVQYQMTELPLETPKESHSLMRASAWVSLQYTDYLSEVVEKPIFIKCN